VSVRESVSEIARASTAMVGGFLGLDDMPSGVLFKLAADPAALHTAARRLHANMKHPRSKPPADSERALFHSDKATLEALLVSDARFTEHVAAKENEYVRPHSLDPRFRFFKAMTESLPSTVDWLLRAPEHRRRLFCQAIDEIAAMPRTHHAVEAIVDMHQPTVLHWIMNEDEKTMVHIRTAIEALLGGSRDFSERTQVTSDITTADAHQLFPPNVSVDASPPVPKVVAALNAGWAVHGVGEPNAHPWGVLGKGLSNGEGHGESNGESNGQGSQGNGYSNKLEGTGNGELYGGNMGVDGTPGHSLAGLSRSSSPGRVGHPWLSYSLNATMPMAGEPNALEMAELPHHWPDPSFS